MFTLRELGHHLTHARPTDPSRAPTSLGFRNATSHGQRKKSDSVGTVFHVSPCPQDQIPRRVTEMSMHSSPRTMPARSKGEELYHVAGVNHKNYISSRRRRHEADFLHLKTEVSGWVIGNTQVNVLFQRILVQNQLQKKKCGRISGKKKKTTTTNVNN